MICQYLMPDPVWLEGMREVAALQEPDSSAGWVMGDGGFWGTEHIRPTPEAAAGKICQDLMTDPSLGFYAKARRRKERTQKGGIPEDS